jgi:hypothetical protein
MSGVVDRDEFIVLLTHRYPEIATDIDDCIKGLLHMEMGLLARAVQSPKKRKAAILATDGKPTKKPSLAVGAVIGYFITSAIGAIVCWVIAARSGDFSNRQALMVLVGFTTAGAFEGYRFAARKKKKLGLNEPGDEWPLFFGSLTFNCLAALVIVGSFTISVIESLLFDLVYGAPWLGNR